MERAFIKSKVAVVSFLFHFKLYLDLDLDRLLLPDLDLLLDELECLPPLPLLEDLDFDLLDFPLRLLFPRLRLLDLEEELELELKLHWMLHFLIIKIQEIIHTCSLIDESFSFFLLICFSCFLSTCFWISPYDSPRVSESSLMSLSFPQ